MNSTDFDTKTEGSIILIIFDEFKWSDYGYFKVINVSKQFRRWNKKNSINRVDEKSILKSKLTITAFIYFIFKSWFSKHHIIIN